MTRSYRGQHPGSQPEGGGNRGVINGDGATGNVIDRGFGTNEEDLSFITVEFEKVGREPGFDFL